MKNNYAISFFLVCCLMVSSFTGWSQEPYSSTKPQVTKALLLGKSIPLRDIEPVDPVDIKAFKKKTKSNLLGVNPNFAGMRPMPVVKEKSLPLNGKDPIRQMDTKSGPSLEIEALVNIEGINSTQGGGVVPPDPCGDVGPDGYLQMTNGGGGSRVRYVDKDGGIIESLTNYNNLWSQFNTAGAGDPVVLFDQEANRWFISEFSNDFVSMMVAMSTTSDPLGAYNVYRVFGNGGLPDYPKFGIWKDMILITTNEAGPIPVYAMSRQDMLDGEAVMDVQRFNITKFNSNEFIWQVATPADWDGDMAPPEDSPSYVLRIADDAWGQGNDRVEVWEVDVDFDAPNQSGISGPINIPLAPFDSYLCNFFSDCMENGNGQLMAAIQHTIMYRVQYRNYELYEAMAFNFTVDVDASENHAGIRWVELRKYPGGDWELYQEGTYAPDNSDRWMGSIAMDGSGSIALGYTVMSAEGNVFPGLRVTGRRASDPLGEMTVPEFEVQSGFSWNNNERWGDYSSMSVDPVNDRTFWFTGEYARTSARWGTKIVSFEITRDSNDLGVIDMLAPGNSIDLTANESVTATFKNFGLDDQTNFDVGYMVNGTVIDLQTIPQTLQKDSLLTYTFPTTVDLSSIEDYSFKVFTALSTDANLINDTIRTVISKLPRYDAAITSFPNLQRPLCEDNVEIGIEITNLGQFDLTSVTIDWFYNGGAVTTIDWTGDLAFEESDVVFVTLTGLTDGDNTMTATSRNPNGIPDEKTNNDELTQTFQSQLTDAKYLTLEINFDLLPSTVTWTMSDDFGDLLVSGGPYSTDLANETITEQICIIDGCYNFRILDAQGNGICCALGEGSYNLTNDEGVIVATGGDFGADERTSFCEPFVCTIAATASVTKESVPGGNDGNILLQTGSGANPIQYSIDGGMTFTTFQFFGGLAGGSYSCVVKDAMNCITELNVFIETCNLQVNVDVDGVSTAGASDGRITINAASPFPPLTYSINGGSSFQDSPVFENLSASIYSVVVIDGLECRKSFQSVAVDLSVGFEEVSAGIFVEILPNPTEGVFMLQVKGLENEIQLPVEVLDATGRVVQRGRLANYDNILVGRLSVFENPAGVYFIRFVHPEMKEMFRIIKK